MAALVEGCRYGLSASESTSARKSIVHVKLTDSALKAIDDYQKNKKYLPGISPSIQFNGSQGELVIPARGSGSGGGNRHFKFSYASIQGDPKGSFECARQGTLATRSDVSNLHMLGCMSNKVTVLANDEVYQATKERMKLAEDESKKSCAQEIKPRGPNSSVIKRKVLHHKPHISSSTTSSSSARSSSPLSLPHNTSSMAPTSSSSSSSQPVPARPLGSSQHPTTAARPTTLRPSPHQAANRPTHHQSSPSSTSKSLAASLSSSSNKSSNNSPVMNVSFRERIIHLLAVRAFKKPELLSRIHKDGIRDKDKSQFGPILKQVSVFNPRDNSYSLSRHLFADVRDDWPFYSDADKQLLKRRKARAAEVPNSASNSPVSLSPAHSPVLPGTQSSKRVVETPDDAAYPTNKKQRIAHNTNPTSVLTTSSSSSTSKKEKTSDLSQNQGPKVSGWSSSADDNNSNKPAGLSFEKDKFTKVESPNSLGESQENNNYLGDAPPATDKVPDYIGKYAAIGSDEQRQRYKVDFNAEYDEYRQLHTKIEQVSRKFRSLVQKIRSKEKGSKGYEAIKNHIYQEYQQVRKDPKYLQQRQRCDYLYKKLGHIKKVISEFDNSQLKQVPSLTS